MSYCENENCGTYVEVLEWMENNHLCNQCVRDKYPDFDEIKDLKLTLKESFNRSEISVEELYVIFKHKIIDELSCSNGELYNNYGE